MEVIGDIPSSDRNRTIANFPTPNAAPEDEQTTFEPEDWSWLGEVPTFSMRNGRPDEVVPYFIDGTLPQAYHWVPVNGIEPAEATRHVEAYIRSALYQMTRYGQATQDAGVRRMQAIVIGALRAGMTSAYELISADLTAAKTGDPMIAVVLTQEEGSNEEVSYTYRCLLANSVPHRNLLTEAMSLTENEKDLVKMCMRVAICVIPIQGHNLMTDGHHYLSDRTKQSYRAFLAIERQIWVTPGVRATRDSNPDELRDAAWHKAGHPVSNNKKYMAATDPAVKARLEAAKLGSAAARLPALEADARAAQTYLRLCKTVDRIWRSMGGGINVTELEVRLEAVLALKKGAARLTGDNVLVIDREMGITVADRKEALDELRRVVKGSQDTVAIAYGFYEAMLESEGGTGTLTLAFSLRKLKSENRGNYHVGLEYYRDYRAWKSKQAGRGASLEIKISSEFTSNTQNQMSFTSNWHTYLTTLDVDQGQHQQVLASLYEWSIQPKQVMQQLHRWGIMYCNKDMQGRFLLARVAEPKVGSEGCNMKVMNSERGVLGLNYVDC